MADNRRFPGGGLSRDTAVDSDGKAAVGGPHPYGSMYRHDSDAGVDMPLGLDPNAEGHSPVFPPCFMAGDMDETQDLAGDPGD